LERIADVTCEGQQAIICLVGEDIHGKPGIAASVFETVASAQVNIRMIRRGIGDQHQFRDPGERCARVVQHLHARFFTHAGAAEPGPKKRLWSWLRTVAVEGTG